jgi:PAS domain S-box-containing protein
MPLNTLLRFIPTISKILPSRPTGAAALWASAYLGAAALWIVFSDQAIGAFLAYSPDRAAAHLYKDCFFAAATSVALFLLFRRNALRLHRVQEAVNADAQRLGAVFRAAPIGIGVVEDRTITTANDRLCAITGYAREELIGRNARMLYPSDAEYESVGREKYAQIRQVGSGKVETRWQKKDGTIIDVRLSSSRLNADDQTAGVTFTALDVTSSRQAETALRKSEAHYRALIELAVDGILQVDGNGIIVDGNHRMCVMLGMDRSDFVGKHISDLPFAAASTATTFFCFDQLRQGEIVVSERTLERPDGTEMFIEMRAKMMPDGSCQSICRDVTQRRQMEQALRESEEKFALAFDASPDAVNINRLEDGLYVAINKGFANLTGYTLQDVAGKSTLDIDVWTDLADRQRMIDDLHACGYCENLEAVFRKKDGSLATGLLSARTLLLDNVPHIISITRDVTRKRQAEANLERLKVAIEQAGEVVVVTDPDGAIQYANPAFVRVTGYAVDEVIRQNPRILKSGEHDEAFYETLWQTITGGRTWTGRMVNKKKDGTLYTEEATISPVFDGQGAIVNFVAIKRDITAQLKLEAQYLQAQKMESVGRLTGGVAHDFNNILAVIIGYAEMALDKMDPDHPVHADLGRIHEAAMRSADIVHQLLAFSRKQPIAPKILDLNSTVEGMLKMLRRLIGESVELRWAPQSGLPLIKMDPTQLDQILANLCVNARDAIDNAGAVTIATGHVCLDADFCANHPGLEPGAHVLLSVADNGCGMEPELIDNIFEPFFTTKGLLGTGLGLSTVYGIVQQNKGVVVAESQPGRGATFRVYLPAQARGVAWSKEAQSEPTLPGRGETILVVEDDPGILELSRTMLTNLGYLALTATSPNEALLREEQFAGRIDLLMTDVIMPGMNGKDLAHRLASRRPEMKLLYMSGYTADVIAHHGVLDEPINFLRKPFFTNELAQKLRETLDHPPPEQHSRDV